MLTGGGRLERPGEEEDVLHLMAAALHVLNA